MSKFIVFIKTEYSTFYEQIHQIYFHTWICDPAFENKFETVKPAISFDRRPIDSHVSKLRRTLGGGGVST
jgi:hypothetical protein